MFAHAFRFDSNAFRAHAFRRAFEPRKPRARWLRVVLGVVGLGLLALLVMFSVFVGAAMIAGGVLYKLWQGRGRPLARERQVVDAEYTVFRSDAADKPQLPR